MVGVEVALLGNQTVTAQGCRGVVVDLVAIVHLAGIKHLLARDGIGHVEALYGTLLVLVGLAGQRLLPVEVRCHGVAVLVFRDHIRLVAAIRRVGQTRTEDAVAHPHHELLILRVGHLRLVHPEAVNRDVLHRCLLTPERVGLFCSHTQIATLHQGHAERSRLGKSSAAHTSHFTAAAASLGEFASEATRQADHCHEAQGHCCFLHL